jgi:hypothetical protein
MSRALFSMQIADAVGVEMPDDGCEPVVFAGVVECLGEVLEDLDEFDGVGGIVSDVVCGGVVGCGGGDQYGTGQGSATGEGKLLLGHGVLAAEAGWARSSWAGGSFSGQPRKSVSRLSGQTRCWE